VALYDCPQFGAGAFTEAFQKSSSDVMKEIAALCDLKFDGPDSNTDDLMVWLNLNLTRLAFTEEVAMRGYMSDQSCMARCLTMDGILKYKNLFQVLEKDPTHTFVHNSGGPGLKGVIVPVREAKDASASGFSSFYTNYGQKHFTHGGDGAENEIGNVDVPLLGAGLPVNEDVRSQIKGRGSRVTYSGYDPGTGSTPNPNVHEFYEKAYYQNLRFLSLFSERIILMVDQCTDVETFDPVAYVLKNNHGGQLKQSTAVSSKYLHGGKTLIIKNGMRYSEAHYLYRPFINALGRGAVAGAEDTSTTAQNANANASRKLTAADATIEATTNPLNVSSQLNKTVPVPAVTAATDSMHALANYNSVFPRIPILPSDIAPTAQMRAAMDSVRSSTNSLSVLGGPLGSAIKSANQLPADTSYFQSVVSLGQNTIRQATGNFNVYQIASDIDRARTNMASFKTTAIRRLTGAASDITGYRISNIVSAATGNSYRVGDLVGEVMGGGIHLLDLQQNGMNVANLNLPVPLPILDSGIGQVTSKYLMNMTGLGLSSNNITINPYQTASAVNRFARTTNPQSLLMTQGANAYLQTFGNVSPDDANAKLKELSVISAKVMQQYGRNEWLSDSSRTNSALVYGGKELLFEFGGQNVAPLVNSVDRIVNYGGYQDVQTISRATTWARIYSMGTNVANAAGTWEPPVFPAKAVETNATAGLPNVTNNSVERWSNAVTIE
jgi:hypothetical protein